MKQKECISSLDINLFIYREGLFDFKLSEIYDAFSFLSYIFEKATSSYIRMSRNKLSEFINKNNLKFRNRTHLVFKYIEVSEDYYFDLTNPNNNYSKGYKVKFKCICDILPYVGSSRLIKNKKVKVKFYPYKGFLYKTKKEIKERFKLTRKQLDKVGKIEYYSLFENPLSDKGYEDFGIFHTKVPKFEYSHKVNCNYDLLKDVADWVYNTYMENGEVIEEEYESLYLPFMQIYKNKEIFKERSNYIRGDFGRLFSKVFAFEGIIAQHYSKRFRSLIFDGQYEYDMNTAVASILLQHVSKLDLNDNYIFIEAYIEDKNFFRNKIIELGFSEKVAKQYFTSLFFGADVLKPKPFSKILKSFTREELDKIIEDDSVQSLVSEVIELFNSIKNHYKKHYRVDNKYVITNEIGKTKEFTPNEFNTKGIPFIYQGIEAKLLDSVIECFSHNCLMFDAFISEEVINPYELEEIGYEETGYKVSWSVEKIEYDKDFFFMVESLRNKNSI